jgi:hypothetical protein
MPGVVPDGILILNLPAFKVLQRKHDIAVFSVRRNCAGYLVAKIRIAEPGPFRLKKTPFCGILPS